MNCLIILLLLCCSGHSNGVCGDNNHKHSCGCKENNNENSCGRNDRCDNDCVKDRCDRCDDDRRNNCREDRREERCEEKCDDRRNDDYRRFASDYQGSRTTPWQDYSSYNRNDSYNRNETCGCEEN